MWFGRSFSFFLEISEFASRLWVMKIRAFNFDSFGHLTS